MACTNFHKFFDQTKNNFCPQKVEKTTLKSCSEFLNSTFFLTALTAQTATTEEFMFQNVAYRPTVYRTGVWAIWAELAVRGKKWI